MTSSTDLLTGGSVHDYDTEKCSGLEETQLISSPKKISLFNRKTSPVKISVDVQEEIDELHENVPQVAQHFTIINKIGSGTFSSVFAARLKESQVKRVFALKHIIPTSHPSRIESELRCLQKIGGKDSVMGVEACFRERDHVIIVMPFFQHTRFQDYVQDLSLTEVQDYMFNLLKSLNRVHQCGIIHRDVKPSNFLYNRKLQKFALVDFGLAQKAPDVASNKSPDVNTSRVGDASQRKTRATTSSNEGASSSPKKRKLETTTPANENHPQSPRKKRLTCPGGLTEINQNGISSQTQPHTNLKPKLPTDSHPNSTETNHLDKKSPPKTTDHKSLGMCSRRGDKSPRRTVLARNALRKQQATGMATLGKSSDVRSGIQLQRKAVIVANGAGGRPVYRTVAPTQCTCYGKPSVCSICMARTSQHAPRAGTPGFRAPEVLLKCPDQTTALDIWSAGVIFLSLLSGRYPFFKAPDDLTALAQIISVFGSTAMHKAALSYGKHVMCGPAQSGYDIQSMCQALKNPEKNKNPSAKSPKNNVSSSKQQKDDKDKRCWKAPESAYHLLSRLLDLNPDERIRAEDALKHPFFSEKL